MTLAAWGALAVIALVAVVSCIVRHEERKNRDLPKPHNDPRDWTGAFMRDWKRR